MKDIIFKHFEVETLDDLLPHFYSHFKKDFIAGLTAKLAKSLNYIFYVDQFFGYFLLILILFKIKVADNNSVIKCIFDECGYQLARHIVAIEPKLDMVCLHNCPTLYFYIYLRFIGLVERLKIG